MSLKLIKTTEIEIGGRQYRAEYFEQETLHGTHRFTCEVRLDNSDRFIVDDDSMPGLEVKVARLAPATIYSRALASRTSVAA